ncbi:hypothetical protein QUF61_06055 [Candidatus Venteria ishoeyi]|uniref:hypothetical protein n=1 Tax=Candidatus Venteria ishoeyi TaxID=1899563 RepID=UPI0025A59341|nr:hypothetical protein [Candidatus Venteria ishoeyi]MDM8546038.1 hypothetical protein [Candidatus Venteria ishoeyi]
MSVRLKTQWHKEKARSLEETASTTAFIIWRISTQTLLELENEGFMTYSNEHRLQVVGECLAFLLQATDRLVHADKMPDSVRHSFINAVALHLLRTYEENHQELYGSGDYRQVLLDLFNKQAEAYAPYAFAGGEAKLDFLRHFATSVGAVLGDSKNKHWIIEQITEINGPNMVKSLRKAVNELFD